VGSGAAAAAAAAAVVVWRQAVWWRGHVYDAPPARGRMGVHGMRALHTCQGRLH
jgi:hypothetical protein